MYTPQEELSLCKQCDNVITFYLRKFLLLVHGLPYIERSQSSLIYKYLIQDTIIDAFINSTSRTKNFEFKNWSRD